ncbi:MAG: beta galactosidase jelly roll domain-containing protein [Victivallales bacterium]|nr:beta galactosidase jelly roll domain-containing protein [Victivallales bacterium]
MKHRNLCYFTTLFILASAAVAEIRLDPVFSSNMVLQRERPIAFFGTSSRHTPVTVTFCGRETTAEVNAQGRWRAIFPAQPASFEGQQMVATDGSSTVSIDDVLIGDVWFCSGQSNMQMPVGAKYVRGWSAKDCEKEVADGNHPALRYAAQRLVFSHLKPLAAHFADGDGWVKSSPQTVPWFSATAYFFGRQLLKDQGVPIGIIMSSWRGTRIEPWISQQGYEKAGLSKELKTIGFYSFDDNAKTIYEANENERYQSALASWLPKLDNVTNAIPEQYIDWSRLTYDDSKWKRCQRFAGKDYQTIWFRKTFEFPDEMKGKTMTLLLNKPAQRGRLFLNGYPIAEWSAADNDYQQPLQLALPAEHIQEKGKNLLAIRATYIYNLYADGLTAGRLLCEGTDISLPGSWKMNLEAVHTAQDVGQPAPAGLQMPYRLNGHQFYSNLYNGMVDAWTHLPVKGVIWYQGCSNAGQPHYYLLLKALINDWRTKWNLPEMPFVIVQLAGFEPTHAKDWMTADATNVSGYALTRDIQAKVADELPNVGLAVTIDIGEADNIHPGNKQDVGLRLALEAERLAYGSTKPSHGPKFLDAAPEGNAIRVRFTDAVSLKTSDGKAPGAFAIAGEDGKFVWADARIDGDSVIVSSPQIENPKFVRYGYAGYRGDCNLQNAAGLPAAPFRSDAVDYSAIK